MAPRAATCEGGLASLEPRVGSLRGASLPGSRSLDASLMGSEGCQGGRRAWEGLVLGFCFFTVAFGDGMGKNGQALKANRGTAWTARALAAIAWAICTSRFAVGSGCIFFFF